MKKKWKYEIVNNQEDEDGYSHYPDSDIICESAKGKQGINSNKSTANTEPGSAKLVTIFPEVKRRISQFMISSSAKLADPIATGTMGKQKNHY
jgi:hypothetical protein